MSRTGPGGGIYDNPFRDVKNLVPERVDMGVDYGGTGPVYALGPGYITNLYNSGWPGGTFISEKLTAGPAAGAYVYVAENITPAVNVGDRVDSSTVIGDMAGGIETGWAQSPGTGNALGATQFQGSNATAYGASYSALLHQLGAPAGVISGPVEGTVPPNIGSGLVGKLPTGGSSGSSGGGLFGGLFSGFKAAAFTIPILLAAAGIAVLGLARMTHAGDKLREINDKGTAAAETAAMAL